MIRSIFYLVTLFFISSCSTSTTDRSVSLKLEELTISGIHNSFQNGEYTSEDLVRAYLERIENIDSVFNSITYLNPDALERAKELDEELKSTGKLRPLHGIPLIVKDNINVKGLPTTAGSLALEDFYPSSDAFIIEKLKEAGAVVLAKSNMAEWAFSPMHTESSTFGITRNPYNPDYVPAGSSGGTGAAIAANLGTVGLGTDTGNSIRGPSSHCSLVGFRTTLGLISRSGIVPLYLRNDVVGPMCRTVEDATKLMEVMAGFDDQDSITRYGKNKVEKNYQKYLDKNGLRNTRIGVLTTLVGETTDPEIQILFKSALNDLKKLGAEVIDSVEVPGFNELSRGQWCGMFKNDVEEFFEEFVKSDTIKTVEDVLRIGTSSEFSRIRLERSLNTGDNQMEDNRPCGDAYTDPRRVAFRESIRKVMDSLELDAIIYPSWINKPATIDHFQEEYKGDNSQIISPHTGQPAFTVPMGFLSNGLPAGLQFLGRMYDEGTLIKLTYSYEQGTKHRKPPKL